MPEPSLIPSSPSVSACKDQIARLLALFDALLPLPCANASLFVSDYPEAEHALRVWAMGHRDVTLGDGEGPDGRWIVAHRTSGDSVIVRVIEETEP